MAVLFSTDKWISLLDLGFIVNIAHLWSFNPNDFQYDCSFSLSAAKRAKSKLAQETSKSN